MAISQGQASCSVPVTAKGGGGAGDVLAARLRGTPVPAYVLGGHEAGLAVVRSLGRAGIPVVVVTTTPTEHARRSTAVSRTVTAPDPSAHARDYVDVLVRLAATDGPGVVFPTTDEALEAVALYRDDLARHHLVACSADDVARTFLDKSLTSQVAAAAGVDAPGTASPTSEAELDECIRRIGFPCLVKPRESYRYHRAFGVKMKRADDADQLRAAWREADALGLGMLIQELVPGPETAGVNYNVYMVDGEPLVEFTSRKLRLAPADFGYPCAVVTASVPEVVEPGRAIVRGMGIEGFANVEFKQDQRDGRYRLMEVNGRPNMSGQLAVHCGVDFPLLTYRHLVDGELPRPVTYPEGVYWIDEARDPAAVAARWRQGGTTARTGAAPYRGSHVFATFSAADPVPFLSRMRAKLRGR
ncbi:ATP-grasp domain-containing protein [Actinomycetospora cinnamomea]|uniref:Putative ATP-grasp superfamily ATP-dependent carboligase n=1 Tax=Actinomycetospora cinnamomea TaxID=663609 RepID=A0A2U1F731_9PSEU|nr:ATP-grasp domain-containing protein [Actinomycetospora cinnamomea]PVZ07978.1 putative ATP-grasp superfamily ATP-dependent carboligase [Actinomycetospora cinnamomea]